MGLQPIGVEFIQGIKFSDWNLFTQSSGFLCLFEGREWSNIRHHSIRRKDAATAKIASKISCYIELANLRIQELATAYYLNLWASWDGELKIGNLCSNTYTRRIDGAIHAAVADLASLRDALSEFIWHYIVKGSEPITRYSSFRKKVRNCDNEVALEFSRFGQDGKWLSNFSNLRNEIIHVAPLGHQGAFHNFEMREIKVSEKLSVPSIHFPILTEDGKVWSPRKSEAEFLSKGNEEEIIKELDVYREYVGRSQDALCYLHNIVESLVAFSKKARIASGLKGEMVHLTDADIVGDVKLS